MLLIIRRVAVHVFVSNRHSTGTSVRLQRCTVVRKCGVHSVNMANVKACYAMQNLKLVGLQPVPSPLRRPIGPWRRRIVKKYWMLSGYGEGSPCLRTV